MGEKPVFSSRAVVFQIDPETKKSWLPCSQAPVPVAFYHDPSRKTYRIISVDSGKALINSTILPSMNFTKTGAKFGQWRDAATNTIYGLGFTNEGDLDKFSNQFSEAKGNVKTLTPKPKTASEGSQAAEVEATTTPTVANGSNDIKKSVGGGEKQGKEGSSTPQRKLSISEPSGSLEAQLQEMRHENDRLKHALAASSCHRDKWETERQKLMNNNTLLRTGLQESKMNVEEWKSKMKQQQEENQKLKQKVQELEAGEAGVETKIMKSVENLKQENAALEKRVKELEATLQEKEKELSTVESQTSELVSLKAKHSEVCSQIEQLEAENADLCEKVASETDKLKEEQTASSVRNQRIAQKNDAIGAKLEELLQLQKEVESELK